jgi:EpsI family protein
MKSELRYWAMVALLVIAIVGLHLMSHGEAVPDRRQLTGFPIVFGAWTGSDLPIQPEIIKVAAVDDYLSRVYLSPQDGPVAVYVGYYKSQRTGQLIHSPKNCLPGSGWEPIRSERIKLTSAEGIQVPVNLYIIENGLRREVVLYWYQSHGRIIASEYWAKIYLVLDAIRMNRTDAALVRVSTPIARDESVSLDRAQIFATQLLNHLDEYLPR